MSTKKRKIIGNSYFDLICSRLSHQLLEDHDFNAHSVLIGIQPRGVYLANKLLENLKKINKTDKLNYGILDPTFFRDDFRSSESLHIPNTSDLDILVENKNVILVDDVIFTGRTARAAMEALFSFGRPNKIEFLTFIDRRFKREVPLKANYVGYLVDTLKSEHVKLGWDKNYNSAEVYITTG